MMVEAIHTMTTPTPGSILTNLEATALNMVQEQMHKLIAKLQANIPDNHKAPDQAQQWSKTISYQLCIYFYIFHKASV